MTSIDSPGSVRNGPRAVPGARATGQSSVSEGSPPAEPDPLAAIAYGEEPAAFVVAAAGAPRDRARRAAQLVGCRLAAAEEAEEAQARPEWPPTACVLLAELAAEPDEALAALLGRIEAEAQRGRRAVVAAPLDRIDLVAACVRHPNVALLCEPSELERVTALALAVAESEAAPRLRDAGRESSLLLQQLAEEVGRIAGILAAMSEDKGRLKDGAARPAAEDGPPVEACFVRAIIRGRRLRDQYLGPNLFADPAWDMMLDLMAARLERNRVAVSSLCIASAVPPTTALRWIRALTDRGLFVRRADPRDGRRVYIELSDETARALGAYLRDVQRVAPTAI